MLRILAVLMLLLPLGEIAAASPVGLEEWWRSAGVRDLSGMPIRRPQAWLVVVFIDPECPVSNGYVPTLNALAAEFSKQGFVFLGAYADPNADLADLQRHVEDYDLKFVAIDDRSQRLARHCGATYTPEAAVVSPEGRVLYCGRIDDRVGKGGAARPAAVRHDLREVLEKLVSGQPGPFPGRPGFGCLLPERVQVAGP
jgi:hypothetical protein